METYNNYIDEFVDWVTGEDTSVQEETEKIRVSDTGGLPVSGGSIRELLQTKLKTPFVYYEDTTAGLYRLFSSESTKNKWIRMNTQGSTDYDPDGSKKLELFNFVRPSDLTMTYDTLNPNPKYIINGDSNSTAARLSYHVFLSKQEGGGTVYESDSFTVTYKITDSNGVEHVSVEEKDSTYLNSATPVTKSIYQYLTVGQNTVEVSMKARSSSARNSVTFPVFLIDFELSSTFDYARHWASNQPIEIPISVKRSDDSLTLQVNVYAIDGTATTSPSGTPIASWTENNGGTRPTHTFNIENNFASNGFNEHIKHMFKIEAIMYDQDQSSVYHSNVLFFDFIIASDEIGITNRFVNIGYSVPFTKVNTTDTGRCILQATQYEPFILPWAYYTDRETTEQTLDIQWAIRITTNEVTTYTPITTIIGKNRYSSETLRFIPDFYNNGREIYLVALYNGTEIDEFPINVSQSNLSISEVTGVKLKLQAYGKTNQSVDKDSWVDLNNNITTTFTNVAFDSNTGWDDNSFITSGTSSYAIVNYCPIPDDYDLSSKGKTLEIEFKSEKVVNNDDVIIVIGDVNKGHIRITTNEAGLYDGNTHIVHTNYKANERIKLAFVFNRVTTGAAESNLIYIINNGILERAASYGEASKYKSDDGIIKIGGSTSGVRVYNIRCYDKPLTPDEELNNFIYDSEDKAEILSRNDIFTSSVIDYTKVKNKIDTVLITGQLDRLLDRNSTKKGSETTVDIKRECITDASKTFEVTNGMIRKHGQSTLSYPITSLKIWTNKSTDANLVSSISLSEQQAAEGLNKNRYIMKTGAIPANKFVLQANYADSSGTHNGSLLRLIQDTWFNANFGTTQNPIYRLRTAPQLFASGYVLTHDDSNLNEDGSWVEGYGVGRALGKTWPEIAGKPFPYTIRNAADSFPCAVFYKNGASDGYHFLGQYVFMDDKKSDHVYGERSIYYFGSGNTAGNDPFVLKTENTKNGPKGKQDTAANRVWDNDNVLRIEVILPNTTLTSYMNFNVTDPTGTHLCTDIKYDGNTPSKYYWEDYFELIFPDGDDIEEDDAKNGLTKFDSNSKFATKVAPFITFLKWITDCKQNYNRATDWWSAGQYSSTQQAFEATAHDHIDPYKLAAYYIFFLRFGLIDSVERNAQLKTYDGQHWHYEPWDMDIALGNNNQGSLILDPPLTRQSFEPGTTTYAYSGKSLTTSNVLWDCLENWTYWAETVVPATAQALYNAGLTYNNIIQMFDNEYANAWVEGMYNYSGVFKYVENGGSEYLPWLQGSRLSHRHWWISTSMNYYDAKWGCGSFQEHRVRIFADKEANAVGSDLITIKPTSDTFFKIVQNEGDHSLGTQPASRLVPAVFDVSGEVFSAKDPSYIYGGTFIEELNVSCLAQKMKAIDVTACYDDVLGAPIKKLNVGIPYTINSSTSYTGKVSGTSLRISAYDINKDADALEHLQDIDVTGQGSITSTQDLISSRNRRNITNVYAIGTSITEFISAPSGNKFDTIKLPGVTTSSGAGGATTVEAMSSITMSNSSWNTIEFWDTQKSNVIQYVRDENDELVLDPETQEPILIPNDATFTKSRIPYQLRTVIFNGSTASNECSGQFVLDWIESIRLHVVEEHPGYTEEQVESALWEELKLKTFNAENISWGTPEQTLRITYKDLSRIAQFNRGNNSGGLIKGYVIISDENELSVEQVANLTNWFGSQVFTKGANTSNLVVDQNLTYIRITASNTYVDNGDICLNEGSNTALFATKFKLSETDSTQYTWSVALGQDNQSSSGTSVNSVRLVTNSEDGVIRLFADDNGTYGDYYVTVTATNTIGGISQSHMITIKIIGKILPTDINIVSNALNGSADPRPFFINNTLKSQMSSIFGNVQNGSTSYVLFSQNQRIEFYPEKVDGTPASNVNINNTKFKISGIHSLYQDYTSLEGGSDGVIYFEKSNRQFGITIQALTLTDTPVVYELSMQVQAAGATWNKLINIILLDDNVVLHSAQTSSGVQASLNQLRNSLGQNTTDLYYKSDLLSLTGTLDFTSNQQGIGSIYAANGVPLLTYLTNINAIDLSGCASLIASSLGTNNASGHIVLPQLQYLTSLSLNGANVTQTIDLTNCTAITDVDFRNSNAGIILPSGSPITSLRLGQPTNVSITNPRTLGETGTTFSIQNSSSLSNVILNGCNITNVRGFTLFDTLYQTV